MHLGEWLFRDSRGSWPGPWRMALIIPGPTLPAATTGCAPILPGGWSRTRIWSIFPTGSRLSFGSAIRNGSMLKNGHAVVLSPGTRSAAGHAVAEPYASRTAKAGAAVLQERRLVSMADMHLGALELDADCRELVGDRHGTFGHRWTRGQRGRQALPQLQRQTSGAAGRRNRGRGRCVSAGAHLPVGYSCRPGGANPSVPRRAASSKSGARSSRNRAISGRNWRSISGKARRWGWRSLASLYTSRDHAISECGLAARKAIARAGRFDAVMADHVLAWKHLVAALRRWHSASSIPGSS